MSGEEAMQELEEVSVELKEKEEIELIETAEAGGTQDDTAQVTFVEGLVNLCQLLFSPVFVQTFILTFLAEWGDRSQIATIAMAAAKVYGSKDLSKKR
ncbi:10693_t:CDS:2 [Racocetra fulgida]|uniref:GDT1 family protein n=1 Tax=Racocetra fulgida TaxID=60492 RepID=A0A9N9F4H9_9GLOM|nr:10693_t:CDS:2 [Racocetra fulgida]